MSADLEILKQIQALDKEIYELRERLEEIPGILNESSEVVKAAEAHFADESDGLKGLQRKQKEKEGELQTKEENVRKYEGQLAQVKTNKEYSSLQAEIRSLKADNSILEENIIGLFDEVEAKRKQVDEAKKILDEKQSTFESRKKEIDQEGNVTKNQVKTLEEKKAELIKQVKPDIAALYEKIVRLRKGIALVQVQGDSCPACQMHLRPQVLNELKLKESLVICENCSRILFE